MSKKEKNRDFTCALCKKYVFRLQNGSFRNHCPFCLSSLHVDDKIPGDRKSKCRGIMKAQRISFNGQKGWQLTHKCTKCGKEKVNKIAEGDSQRDDWDQIIKLS